MDNKKKIIVTIIMVFITLLSQLSCSNTAMNLDNIVSCSDEKNPIPINHDFKFSGDLLFLKSDHSEILAFNGETHNLTSIFKMPSDEFYGVSPLFQNSEMLAVFNQKPFDKENLFITTLSNRGIVETKSIRFPNLGQNHKKLNTWIPLNWVNKDYLLGILYDKQNNEDNLWEPWLLNFEKLEWKSLSGINDTLDPIERSGFSISPDLTRVLYVNKQYQLVLYDLIQNQAIWTHSDYDGLNPFVHSAGLTDATWSENGEILATNISNNGIEVQPSILVMDKNGEILHSLGFGTKQFGLSWSNDKKFLSFWGYQKASLITANSSRPVIRIMDVGTGLVKDLCMLSESEQIVDNIFWSPDQNFLAYNLQNNDTKRNEVIVQELNDPQLRVLRLDDKSPHFDLLGWSKEHWSEIQP
jgi:hypothetical protein